MENYRSPSGAGGSSSGGMGQRSGPPLAPSLHSSGSASQRRIPQMLLPKKTNMLGMTSSKFFIHDHIPAYKAESPHFKNMIAAAQETGTYNF